MDKYLLKTLLYRDKNILQKLKNIQAEQEVEKPQAPQQPQKTQQPSTNQPNYKNENTYSDSDIEYIKDSKYENDKSRKKFSSIQDSYQNEKQNQQDTLYSSSADINANDFEENENYIPEPLDYDPVEAGYEKFLETGDDSYLYGNKFPVKSEEHIKWASIHEPKRYFNKRIKSLLNTIFKNVQAFNNQNNPGFNQYNNPNKIDTEISNALNTTAPVNGAYSTSNMEQAQPTGALTNYNSVTNNANPTGKNGINTQGQSQNSTSYITQTTVNIDTFKNKLNSTPQPQLKMNESVVDSVKKQLQEMGKEFERKEGKTTGQEATVNNVADEQKFPMSMDEAKREIDRLPKEMFKSLEVAEDGYVEEDANQLPLSAEKEKEVEQFFQPDEMVEKMDQKSLKIKQLLKSLKSLSDNEAIFKDIKNATKYAKIYNTKIASHNEKAYVVMPTLKDINMFGKRIFKVDIKKY